MNTEKIKTTVEAQITALTGAESDAELLALSKAADSVGADRAALDAIIQGRITALTNDSETRTLLALAKAVESGSNVVPVGGSLAINQDGPLVVDSGRHYLRTGHVSTDVDTYVAAKSIKHSASTFEQSLPGNGDICAIGDGFLCLTGGTVHQLDSNMDNPIELITGLADTKSIAANTSLIYVLTKTEILRYHHNGTAAGGNIDITVHTSNPRSLAADEGALYLGESLKVVKLKLAGGLHDNPVTYVNSTYSGQYLFAKSLAVKNDQLWASVENGDIIIFELDGTELQRINPGNSYIAPATDTDGYYFWASPYNSSIVRLYRHGDVVGNPSAKTDSDTGYPIYERIK